MTRRFVVGVMGPAEGADGASLAAARELGALLAREGWVVLTGGRDADWLSRYRQRLDDERETMDANLQRLAAAGAIIATGTDAGNPLTLHGPAIYAEMEAMQAAGLSPMQVIVASTRNAALAMGRSEDFGTVEPGKAADLLVLGADPTEDVANFRELDYVMRAGVLHEQADLRAR